MNQNSRKLPRRFYNNENHSNNIEDIYNDQHHRRQQLSIDDDDNTIKLASNNDHDDDAELSSSSNNIIIKQSSSFESNNKHLIILGLLYFTQGFPYGFQDKFVPLLLLQQRQSSTTIGFTRILLLLWLMKPLFAPLIDMTLTATKWICISLFGLILISFYNALYLCMNDDDVNRSINDNYDHNDNDHRISWQFIITLFLLNFLSSFQDIAVDAITVNICSSENDMMAGNVGQILGYKLGSFFGSGILYWIYLLFNLNGLFMILTIIYSIVLLLFIAYSKNENKLLLRNKSMISLRKKFDDNNHQTMISNGKSMEKEKIQIKLSMNNIYLYIFIYKLGEYGSIQIFPIYLQKIARISIKSIAFWNGTIGIICSMLGSLLASRLSISMLNKMLKYRLLPLCSMLIVIIIVNYYHYYDFNNSNNDQTFDINDNSSSGDGDQYYHHYFSDNNHKHHSNQSIISRNILSISKSLIYYISIVSILMIHFIGGIITTMTFTLMMMICRSQQQQQQQNNESKQQFEFELEKLKRNQSNSTSLSSSSSSLMITKYTIMSTIEVLGKLLLSSFAGLFVDQIGFVWTQTIFIALSVIPCFIYVYH